MSWDWNSPIALGLFILMCGGAAVLVGVGISAALSGARWVRGATNTTTTRRR